MQWSKAKQRAESLFAPSVAGRVALRVTGYRAAPHGEGRGWIAVDGEEAWSFCTFRHDGDRYQLAQGIRSASASLDWRDPAQLDNYRTADDQAAAILAQRGIVGRSAFTSAIEEYASMSVEEALASDNLIHRALAVLDRRLGRRRLRGLEFRTDEHPLVTGLYRFRQSCEGHPVLENAPSGRTRG